MWLKYPNGKFGGPLKPSTNPRNPNSLDKLAALVQIAEQRYREKYEAKKENKQQCMS